MNEITIVVQARNATKAVFDAVRADAKTLGVDIGTKINEDTTQVIKREAASGSGAYAQAGDKIGQSIGDHITQRINVSVRDSVHTSVNDSVRVIDRNRSSGGNGDQHVRVSVDVDKKSFLSQVSGAGDDAAKVIDEKMSAGVQQAFSGDVITVALKTISIGALVTVLSPVLGAAVSTVVLGALGGGVIGAGIYGALKDPQIQSSITKLKGQFKSAFSDFSDNFKFPLQNFFERVPGLFKQLDPMFQHLGQVFAPITDNLGRGIIGFLQNAMPGILRAAEKSAPIFKTLGDKLPGLGDAVGKFFDDIGAHGPEAAHFFGDLITAVGLLIRALGKLIGWLTGVYDAVRVLAVGWVLVFGIMLEAATRAFFWIPGIGPKLDRANQKFQEFSHKAVKALSDIPKNVDITVRIRQVYATVGSVAVGVARLLAGRASGGIIGGAHEPVQRFGTAASGGVRSGLTWVGENGPELMDAPAGTRVHSAQDSARIAGQGGGGRMGPIVVQLVVDGRVIAESLADPMRKFVGDRFGGSVQLAYGR